jgi:UDP-glucuronate 4-epimerase
VRYSLENPFAYADSNLLGMLTVLEGCRAQGVRHLVYASSSSVYGANEKLPFSVGDRVDTPISLYAATKRANESMAHVYAHLYAIPATGLRFFTVYGPWGRPDMAYYKFADAIMAGRPIDVFNHGDMKRDFTYIDDVSAALLAIVERGPRPPAQGAPHRLYNIGHHQPEALLDMIATLEGLLGRQARKNLLPMQPGDVAATFADIADIHADYGFEPRVSLAEGLGHFVDWYLAYHGHAPRSPDAR